MTRNNPPFSSRRLASAMCGVILAGSTMIPALAQNGDQPLGSMLRYPDVSASHIVFLYANDLWTVSRDGGVATPLASPPGVEGFPKFSADGETIAFVGNYDGGTDIYTMPTAGGIPHRVTYHPSGERLCDWTPDGRLLFASNGTSFNTRTQQLKVVSPEGGMPEELPVPYGSNGAISPDGNWLAYQFYSRDFRTWKRYMGGLAGDLWLFNLNTNEARKATEWLGTDTIPMWNGSALYYLSDEGPNARLNIWAYDPNSGERAQITDFEDFDVKFPSMGPGPNGQGEIVFQNGSDLMLLDLSNNQTSVVDVTIPGGRPSIRPRTFDARRSISSWGISATGKRAVVEARGDIWTAPAEHGIPRNLTRTDDVAERTPAWSPDGRWIAYFSDATGDYQVYVTQSDGQGETRQLTDDLEVWLTNMWWSPDSEMIVFTEKTGAINLLTVETGEWKQIDKEPTAFRSTSQSISFSHDSRFITYAKCADDTNTPSIWIYDIENEERHQVTSGVFPDGNPVFDREGKYLYFTSSRTFSPTYSDLDTTFIYENSGNILAVPLKADLEYVWKPKTDEEEWKEDEESEDEEGEGEEGEGEGEDEESADDDGEDDGDNGDADDEEDEENGDDEVAAVDDGVSGTWEGSADVPDMGELPVSVTLTLADDNSVTGFLAAGPFSGDLSGSYNPGEKRLNLILELPDGAGQVVFDLQITNGEASGTATGPDGEGADISLTRTSTGTDEDDEDGEDGESDKKKDKVEIDFEGFEHRAILLPVGRGNFRNLAVNDKNHLLYIEQGEGIKVFDIEDDDKKAKDVQAGGFGFDISGDGKKLLYASGGGASIRNAAAGGSSDRVNTDPMDVLIRPRAEWHQILRDVHHIFRDYFYVSNMHGVDWDAMHAHYDQMIDDCTTREDVSFVIGELIGELNVGHAYVFGSGPDGESAPGKTVGLLGCDYEYDEANDAYRIARIYHGGPWDADARGPLSKPGVKANEGDYLLAVNGIPVDTSKDPWAAFVGLTGHPTYITLSDQPTLDAEEADQREFLVEPIGNESYLRYRAWIEHNRSMVEEMTDGRVGYVHVPDTGVNGQNNLVRQMVGQLEKGALIVDERWNGGGQIPTRFIEMLNRPATNYWATQDGRDWRWPPDSHQGPKCMLINGPSGSGGDCFPHYFRQAGLGKLIGTRTWGGLVGISGNPGLKDGSYVSVPTFGFYEMDGTWGIEGYGVAPDIAVVDDPSKMVDGGDPQLEAAIAHILEELEANPYVPPTRPDGPDRTTMGRDGIPEDER